MLTTAATCISNQKNVRYKDATYTGMRKKSTTNSRGWIAKWIFAYLTTTPRNRAGSMRKTTVTDTWNQESALSSIATYMARHTSA